MQTLREQLLSESKGIKDTVKWLEKKIKEKRKAIEGDSWYYYYNDNHVEKAIIEELIKVKVGLEKYSKKLKHMANEA